MVIQQSYGRRRHTACAVGSPALLCIGWSFILVRLKKVCLPTWYGGAPDLAARRSSRSDFLTGYWCRTVSARGLPCCGASDVKLIFRVLCSYDCEVDPFHWQNELRGTPVIEGCLLTECVRVLKRTFFSGTTQDLECARLQYTVAMHSSV